MTARRAVVGDARRNNFDLLRIAAATMVLTSHAFPLTGHAEPHFRGSTLGEIGVFVFFGISGFLVTQSWERDPHVWRFLFKRALRLFPALVVVLLLSALILGAVVTTRDLSVYLIDGQTWTYVGQNLLMWRMDYTLNGVFASNPYPEAVNGSLWTLPSELHAYIALAMLGVVGVLSHRKVATALLVVVLAMAVQSPWWLVQFGAPLLFASFAAGALLALWRREIRWRWSIAVTLLAAWIVLPVAPAVLGAVAIPYVVLMLAYRVPAISDLLKGRDVSYGTYLYAFPVQQTVVLALPAISVLGLIAISLPITLLFAAGSWFWIERPALRLKPRSSTAAERRTIQQSPDEGCAATVASAHTP